MQHVQHRARANKKGPGRDEPTKFGELITTDHFIARGEESIGIKGSEAALCTLDVGAGFRGFGPTGGRNMIEARDHLLHFAGPKQRDQVELLYTDNAPELIAELKA